MKKRILNLGVPATHDSIVALPHVNDPITISDFDAFVFDPLALQSGAQISAENHSRRQREITDLILVKGGIVLCIARPISHVPFISGGGTDNYDILGMVAPQLLKQLRAALRPGLGSRIELVQGARGASMRFLRGLAEVIRFAAYLDTANANLESVGGTVQAVDSVGHPISVEFVVGGGRLCMVPVPEGVTGDRIGSAIARVVEAHYGGPSDVEVPEWALAIDVPGATANDAKISELENKRQQITVEITSLQQNRSDLLRYRALLYGYGKSILEPVVRSALRLLGFQVPEPEEYAGEWDVELHQPESTKTAIAEVEGSTGVIDVDKYRQLLDYVQAEILEGRDHKGVLIGNGFRLSAIDAADRKNQFSEHALRGAKKNDFCLLPTTELFKAVCAVLENPSNEGLKIKIRGSLLSTVGMWTLEHGQLWVCSAYKSVREMFLLIGKNCLNVFAGQPIAIEDSLLDGYVFCAP